MKQYECIKTLVVDKYDEDGFLVENESFVITEGSLWERDDQDRRIAGGEVHLDSVSGYSWLEVSEETLKEYFKEV